ncbi:MAG: radical SAM protein [Deltaproteobacteria bacterium]|nr:radical SAM protein [Deltaproteobacteria bacterium]
MRNLDINLGRACNNRCLFCSNGDVRLRPKGWMGIRDVERELETQRASGWESVCFLGGEPTLYPELERAIAHARQLGYRRVAICTNGSRLADPDRLERLLESGLNRVAFSIHAHRASLEDAITRRPGSFDEKLRALDQLVGARDAGRLEHGLSFNSVLHAKILGKLLEFVTFFNRRGLGDIRLNFIRPEHEAVGSREWVPALGDLTVPMRELAARNEAEWKMDLSFADVPWCFWPWELLASPALCARYAGEEIDLSTRVSLYNSDLPMERFDWKEQRTSKLKRLLEGCAACPLVERCEGVWRAYLDIYGESEIEQGPARVRAALGS